MAKMDKLDKIIQNKEITYKEFSDLVKRITEDYNREIQTLPALKDIKSNYTGDVFVTIYSDNTNIGRKSFANRTKGTISMLFRIGKSSQTQSQPEESDVPVKEEE